mmetsp:Transcript_21177/g.63205  ORF Transcript_21177/g.63205 Transcript_21177/m.63205 type:complete len:249 (-) Transcript_21177:16-762(-)
MVRAPNVTNAKRSVRLYMLQKKARLWGATAKRTRTSSMKTTSNEFSSTEEVLLESGGSTWLCSSGITTAKIVIAWMDVAYQVASKLDFGSSRKFQTSWLHCPSLRNFSLMAGQAEIVELAETELGDVCRTAALILSLNVAMDSFGDMEPKPLTPLADFSKWCSPFSKSFLAAFAPVIPFGVDASLMRFALESLSAPLDVLVDRRSRFRRVTGESPASCSWRNLSSLPSMLFRCPLSVRSRDDSGSSSC